MKLQKFCIAIAFISLMACKSKAKSEVYVITKAELVAATEKEDVQLLDVRRPDEYELGHIEGAQNLNILDEVGFEKGANKLDKEKPIYIYCQAGKRSKKASEKLKAMGFITIYDFSAGYGSWGN